MRVLLILVILLSSTVVADIYKWRENGNVHYSDKAKSNSNAKKVELPAISEYKAVKTPGVRIEDDPKNSEINYKVEIISPSNNQVFINTDKPIELEIAVKPSLLVHAGHKIQYKISSKVQYTTTLKTNLSHLDRGSHILELRIVDNKGQSLSSSLRRVIHIRKDSKQIKNNLKKSGLLAPQAK